MPWVMRQWHFADSVPQPVQVDGGGSIYREAVADFMVLGSYLQAFDPEAYAGRGAIVWTSDVAKAMKFEDAYAVLSLWRTQSKLHPIRQDGKANRPLTHYSVMPEQVP